MATHKDFEDFLMDYCVKNNPQWLDDDYTDMFDHWLEGLDTCEWLQLGNKYAKTVKEANLPVK